MQNKCVTLAASSPCGPDFADLPVFLPLLNVSSISEFYFKVGTISSDNGQIIQSDFDFKCTQSPKYQQFLGALRYQKSFYCSTAVYHTLANNYCATKRKDFGLLCKDECHASISTLEYLMYNSNSCSVSEAGIEKGTQRSSLCELMSSYVSEKCWKGAADEGRFCGFSNSKMYQSYCSTSPYEPCCQNYTNESNLYEEFNASLANDTESSASRSHSNGVVDQNPHNDIYTLVNSTMEYSDEHSSTRIISGMVGGILALLLICIGISCLFSHKKSKRLAANLKQEQKKSAIDIISLNLDHHLDEPIYFSTKKMPSHQNASPSISYENVRSVKSSQDQVTLFQSLDRLKMRTGLAMVRGPHSRCHSFASHSTTHGLLDLPEIHDPCLDWNEKDDALNLKIDTLVEQSKEIPSPLLPIPLSHNINLGERKLRVVHSYMAQRSDELTLSIGQILQFKKQYSDGWAYGTDAESGLQGTFPLVCVQDMD